MELGIISLFNFSHSNGYMGFPGGSDVKVFARDAGDPGSIPG